MENAGAPGPTQKPDDNRSKPLKGKSCKGTLYYSSILRSKGRNPRCVGIRGSLQEKVGIDIRSVYIVGEVEASKEGRNLSDFKYVCLGYSVYPDKNGASDDGKDPGAKWPVCVGVELVMEGPVVDNASVDAHSKERDDRGLSQPRPPKPTGDEFLMKFARSGNLVASGVAKNMCKVGNYIKDSVDDLLYPFKRRPK